MLDYYLIMTTLYTYISVCIYIYTDMYGYIRERCMSGSVAISALKGCAAVCRPLITQCVVDGRSLARQRP